MVLLALVLSAPTSEQVYAFHHKFKVGDVATYQCTSKVVGSDQPNETVEMTAKERVIKLLPDGGAVVEYTFGGYMMSGQTKMPFPADVETMHVSAIGAPNEKDDHNAVRISLFGNVQEPLAALKHVFKIGDSGAYESVDPPLTNIHHKGTLRLVAVEHGVAHFACAEDVFIGGTQKLDVTKGDYWIDIKTAELKRAILNIERQSPEKGIGVITMIKTNPAAH